MACHMRVARCVDRDAGAKSGRAAAQVSGIDQSGAIGIDLRDKGRFIIAEVARLDRIHGGEIGRLGPARYESIARAVHSNGAPLCRLVAPEQGGVHDGRTSRVDFGNKAVLEAR